MSNSIFRTERALTRRWPYWWRGQLSVSSIAGNHEQPGQAATWVMSKLVGNTALVRQAVSEAVLEGGLTVEAAVKKVADDQMRIGFQRDESGELYYEGWSLKNRLKHAASVTWPNRTWGPLNMSTLSWLPEHLFVLEERLPLGVTGPTDVAQIVTPATKLAGKTVSYREFCANVTVTFTLVTDYEFSPEDWEDLWLCAERCGIGEYREGGFGSFEVVAFDRIAPVAVVASPGSFRTQPPPLEVAKAASLAYLTHNTTPDSLGKTNNAPIKVIATLFGRTVEHIRRLEFEGVLPPAPTNGFKNKHQRRRRFPPELVRDYAMIAEDLQLRDSPRWTNNQKNELQRRAWDALARWEDSTR